MIFHVRIFFFQPQILIGEIVIKPHNQKREGIINALISLDKYFKIDPEFKIYQPFNGHKDLLFKVSQRKHRLFAYSKYFFI